MGWWLRRQSVATSEMPTLQSAANHPSPDNAWKTLELIIDWIKHAETKAVATLGVSGVIGGVLYTLVKNEHNASAWFGVSASICAVFMFGAGIGAGMALRPRLRSPKGSANLLYYDHIASKYHTNIDAYTDSLTTLILDHKALIVAIAGQVWANAHVARRKYYWGSVGIISLLLALVALAATAILDRSTLRKQ
jgi:hypothetical protein